MRGRKPKPTAQKILEGNRGRRPLNHDEPQPELGAPEPPENFSPEARACWDRTIAELVSKYGLAKVDFGVLEAYCDAVATLGRVRPDVNKSLYMRSPIGVKANGEVVYALKKNIALGIQEKAQINVAKLASELGLSPSSRSRIKVKPSKPVTPFGEYQKRRAAMRLVADKKREQAKG